MGVQATINKLPACVYDRNVWHAGDACEGFQARATHVQHRVRECDLIKDSFAWCIGRDTPALINRDQDGTGEHVPCFFFMEGY